MNTFPIPHDDHLFQSTIEALALQTGRLQRVSEHLANTVGAGLSAQENALKSIQLRLKRRFDKMIADHGRALASVDHALSTSLIGTLAEQHVRINQMFDLPTMPPGDPLPPGNTMQPPYGLYIKCDTREWAIGGVDQNTDYQLYAAYSGWQLITPQYWGDFREGMQWATLNVLPWMDAHCPKAPAPPATPVGVGADAQPVTPPAPPATVPPNTSQTADANPAPASVYPIPDVAPAAAPTAPPVVGATGAMFGGSPGVFLAVDVAHCTFSLEAGVNDLQGVLNLTARGLVGAKFYPDWPSATAGAVADLAAWWSANVHTGQTAPTVQGVSSCPPVPVGGGGGGSGGGGGGGGGTGGGGGGGVGGGGGGGGPCTPVPCTPTPCTPVPCVPAPPIPRQACNVPAGLQGGMPAVGSADFCRLLPQIQGQLTALGHWIVNFAVQASGVDALIGPIEPPTADSFSVAGFIGSINPWKWLFSAVASSDSAFCQNLRSTLTCWKQVLQQTQVCDIDALIGLAVLRAAFNLLQKLRGGTDAVLWLTVDMEVVVDPLVQIVDYITQSICPAEIPSVGETIDALIRSDITEDQARCWMRMRGADFDVWTPVIAARREKLTPEEYIQYGLRVDYTRDQIDGLLKRVGFTNDSERSAKYDLYFELPTIQDHLHWLQRNVFDNQYVTDYGLLEGFTTRFWPRFGHDLTALGMKQEYAELHYAAHWIQPSPGQLAEMLQRLRPGRVPATVQFTEADYLRLLAEQDVAPYFRARMRAIAYQQPALRFLRQLYDTAQIDTAELTQRFQDLGYSPADAGILAESERVNRAKRRETAVRGYTPAACAKLYAHNLMTADEVRAKLAPQGFTADEVQDLLEVAALGWQLAQRDKHLEAVRGKYAAEVLAAFEAGAIADAQAHAGLTSAGYTQESADIAIGTANLRATWHVVRDAIKAVRRSMLRGELTQGQATDTLMALGVVADKAIHYTASWALELSVPRQAAGAAKILAWVKKGLLSVPVARQRLLNLGFPDPDATLMIAEVEQEVLQQAAKAETVAQTTAAKRQQRLLQLQKQAEATVRKTQALLAKGNSPAKLIKRYAVYIMDEAAFRDRLRTTGYTQQEIDDLFKEAILAREKVDAKAAKSGPAGVEYTGQGNAGHSPGV